MDELRQTRIDKLGRLAATGVNPYPPRVERTHTTAEALAAFSEEEAVPVRVAGRLVAMRNMGKAAFAHIQDGDGRAQLYFKADDLGPALHERLAMLDLGDFIGAGGYLFRTRTGEITVHVRDFTVLAKALLPLPEKWHGLTDVEKRYRMRYLDFVANPEARQIMVTRARVISAMRAFLDQRAFIEFETPILQPVYGGAMARPFTTFHNKLEETLYLRIAPELYHKRLIIGGFDRVYEIGKSFRNEGVDWQHNPEFTTLELYQAYADYRDIMALTEQMVEWIARAVLGATSLTYQEHTVELAAPWRRQSLRDAILEHGGIDIDAYPERDALAAKMTQRHVAFDARLARGKLVDELFKTFVVPKTIQPTFIHEYPLDLSPLTKQSPTRPDLVERFQPLIAGMEMGNAYTELNDPLDQRARFENQQTQRAAGDAETHELDIDFLEAMEHGMPPTGGLGVGVDRLVMLLTNQTSIREVLAFPQLRERKG